MRCDLQRLSNLWMRRLTRMDHEIQRASLRSLLAELEAEVGPPDPAMVETALMLLDLLVEQSPDRD